MSCAGALWLVVMLKQALHRRMLSLSDSLKHPLWSTPISNQKQALLKWWTGAFICMCARKVLS